MQLRLCDCCAPAHNLSKYGQENGGVHDKAQVMTNFAIWISLSQEALTSASKDPGGT